MNKSELADSKSEEGIGNAAHIQNFNHALKSEVITENPEP